jgi:hypothetical protein
MLARTLLLVLLAASACDKGSNAAPAATTEAAKAQGKTFGAGVKLAQATPIDTILANPKDWNGKTVRVEG